jgi:hypothetical protein
MPTKYKPVKINFTEEEYKAVKTYAEQCNMSMVELCRMLLNRYHPKPTPTEAYRVALEQLYKLHKRLDEDSAAAFHLRQIILLFQKEALLPERGDGVGHNKHLGYKRTHRPPNRLCGKSRKDSG